MVYKICKACNSDSSWRYHTVDTSLISFLQTLSVAFDFELPSKQNVLCHSCHGKLIRTRECVFTLKENCRLDRKRTLTETHKKDENEKGHSFSICDSVCQIVQPDASGDNRMLTDLPANHMYHQITLPVHSSLTGSSAVSNEIVTTGVKRAYHSDHAYFEVSNDSEHDYCNLFGQEDDSSEDEDYYDNDTLKQISRYCPPVNSTHKYDYLSVLQTKSLKNLVEDDIFTDTAEEMNERCPDLLQAFLTVAVKDGSDISMRHIASIVMAYSCLMFARNNRNSAMQKHITMMAVKGNANDELIRRLNRLSMTLSCSGKIKLLDKANNTTRTQLIEAVKENPRLKITGDNLDMYVRTNHQRQDNVNKDIHWFASNVTLARIDYSNISNEKPNVELEDIEAESFLLNESEGMKLRDVKKVIIGRIIGEIENFSWIKKKLPAHIPHRYSEYMSRKQEVFGLPVFFKNESKNEDCLDIMDKYEEELIDIFNKAYGNLDNLNKFSVVLGGDQLTRERLQNVKNIRNMAVTPQSRFQHLSPIVCELWHVKQDLLSKAYKALFNAENMEKGTLYHAKIVLRRTDVTGNVKSNYKAHEELLLLMVKALIHIAADDMMEDTEDRDLVLDKIYSRIHGEGYGSDDLVLNYFVNLVIWGLQILNMNDTAKEGDMERVIINCKENIPLFYGHSIMSKYYSEMVNLLLLTEHILSSEMKVRVLEGCFINTKGGTGNNKEADLVQENCIRNKKDLIRSLGANKTEKAVMRACSAADTCYRSSANIDKRLGIPKLSSNHTKMSSSKDLEVLIKLLKQVKPFEYRKGRKFIHFENIHKNPKAIVCREDLIQGLNKKIFRLFLNC